jgi:hypothetical protein
MGWVRAIAVDPGNQWFATGAGDRVVKVCLLYSYPAYMLMADLGLGIRRVEAIIDWTHLYHPWSNVGIWKPTRLSDITTVITLVSTLYRKLDTSCRSGLS